MALVLPSENDHTTAQALLALEATRLARQRWRSGMSDDFDASWASVRPAVEAVTRSAMVGSAANGGRLVPRQLAQAGHTARPEAVLVPETFGTQTMLGVDVGQALDSTRIRTKVEVGNGATVQEALDVGEEWLDELIRSVMADVDRAAQQALVTATPRMGWVRICPAPCCARCAVLSGRWYRYSAGFQRHKRCDCFHRIAPQDGKGTEDVLTPEDLFKSGGVKDVTQVEADAIKDGADVVDVLNSRRGRRMTTTGGRVMTRQHGRGQRLTPAGIYRLASDRNEAVRLLAANGYIR